MQSYLEFRFWVEVDHHVWSIDLREREEEKKNGNKNKHVRKKGMQYTHHIISEIKAIKLTFPLPF